MVEEEDVMDGWIGNGMRAGRRGKVIGAGLKWLVQHCRGKAESGSGRGRG